MNKTAAQQAYARFVKRAEEEEMEEGGEEEEGGGERTQWMTPGKGALLGGLTGGGAGASAALQHMLRQSFGGRRVDPRALWATLPMAGIGALIGRSVGKGRVEGNRLRDLQAAAEEEE